MKARKFVPKEAYISDNERILAVLQKDGSYKIYVSSDTLRQGLPGSDATMSIIEADMKLSILDAKTK